MRTWITSDHHFYHTNILTFLNDDDTRMRDFASRDEMHEVMIERWNSKISPDDKVYHLGDIVMRTTSKYFEVLDRLNGKKVLIKGNHDGAKISVYQKYFTDIRASMHKKTPNGINILFTHIPIHPGSLQNGFNVHGHTHNSNVADYRYINVSVEQTEYYPVLWDDLVFEIERRAYDH